MKDFFWKLIFIVFISAAIVTSIYIYRTKAIHKENTSDNEFQQVTSRKTNNDEKPEEEIPSYEKSDYQISILNGNGVRGAASEMRIYLEKYDYNVVTLGNAERYSYDETVVRIGKKVPKQYKDELVEIVSAKYFVDKSLETLDKDMAVEIVVGARKR